MADVAVREPAWLAARREKSAARAAGLDLPQFKGHAGWEFTELGSFEWDAFAESSTWQDLALFGFPPPGHAIWDDAMLDATAQRYPKLDLTPWRESASRL